MTPSRTLLLFGALAAFGPQTRDTATAVGAAPPSDICWRTASAALSAAREELRSDYSLALAKSGHMTDVVERDEFLSGALDELLAGLDESELHFAARVELCGRLGDGAYDPEIDPEDFVDLIDNPFMPLTPGTVMLFEGFGADGIELMQISVSHETREVLGVECTIVHELTTTQSGQTLEETWDYFAQDVEGNVWYFGEATVNYEDGFLANMDGSWIAGEEGGKPGIVMPATPVVGQSYRTEFQLGTAEDISTVYATGMTVDTPYGRFHDCLVMVDQSPLDPIEIEFKYYAPGIGFVFERDAESGATTSLMEIR